MRRLAGVLALPLLILTACGNDDAGGAGTVYDQPGEQVTVEAGEQFTIELASNPSTGYTWQLAQPPGDQVALVDQDYEPEGDPRPGSSGFQRFVFEGMKVGTTELTFSYLRPWETGVPPTDTATFPVSVE
jgi:inhibitor of cysteine peptidase